VPASMQGPCRTCGGVIDEDDELLVYECATCDQKSRLDRRAAKGSARESSLEQPSYVPSAPVPPPSGTASHSESELAQGPVYRAAREAAHARHHQPREPMLQHIETLRKELDAARAAERVAREAAEAAAASMVEAREVAAAEKKARQAAEAMAAELKRQSAGVDSKVVQGASQMRTQRSDSPPQQSSAGPVYRSVQGVTQQALTAVDSAADPKPSEGEALGTQGADGSAAAEQVSMASASAEASAERAALRIQTRYRAGTRIRRALQKADQEARALVAWSGSLSPCISHGAKPAPID